MKMKFCILQRLPHTLSSTCWPKFSSSQRCLSLLRQQRVEHLRCLVTLPAYHQTHKTICHSLWNSSTLDTLTRLKIPVCTTSSHLCCRGLSVDVKNIFKDNDKYDNDNDDIDKYDNDHEEENDTHTEVPNKRHRSILGSKSLTEFKEKCKNVELQMSPKDWEDLRERVLAENPQAERAWEVTCVRLLYAARNMELAESFMTYIRGRGTSPKLATLATFIALCGECYGKHKQEMIFEAYEEMLRISDLFDSITTKSLIQGFSQTDRWRKCLDFIEMTKVADNPTTVYYSPVVCAALREGQTDLAVSLLQQMGEEGMRPLEHVFQGFAKKLSDRHSGITINTFMDILRKYHWLVSEETIVLLEEYFKRSENRRYKSKFSQVNKGGVCQSCKHRLKRLELSDAEFEVLQREMLENVLIGENVYFQSNPGEVERFKDFVQEHAPFDVVLDALNIAHLSITGNAVRKPNSLFLKKVVDHFARFQRQRVLVIGRQHMKAWTPRDMQHIERVAKTFYTDNISKDDPFSLYAAMYSGKSCLILSQDHMKDHKFKLGPHMKEAFEQWQRSHQITSCAMERGRMYVEMPVKHETGPQEDGKGWHIPYEDQSERPGYQRPNTWLCVRDVGGKSRKKSL